VIFQRTDRGRMLSFSIAAILLGLLVWSLGSSPNSPGGLFALAICGGAGLLLAIDTLRQWNRPLFHFLGEALIIHEDGHHYVWRKMVRSVSAGFNKTVLLMIDGGRIKISHASFGSRRELRRFQAELTRFMGEAQPVAPHEPPPRASVSDASDDRTLDSLPAPGSSGGR
jgi:hypothetical protein